MPEAAPRRRLLKINTFCYEHDCGRTKAYELIKAGKIDVVDTDFGPRITGESAERYAASLQRMNPKAAA
jgi:hypothetical protein